MTNKVVVSFIQGAGGRFLSGVINHLLCDTSLDIFTKLGSAHNDEFMRPNHCVANWNFFKEYFIYINDTEGLRLHLTGPMNPRGSTQPAVRRVMGKINKNTYEPYLFQLLAENYNSSSEVVTTHWAPVPFLRSIFKYHNINPIIVQISVSDEEDFDYCNFMHYVKNQVVADRPFSLDDIIAATAPNPDDPYLMQYSVKLLIDKDEVATLNFIMELASKLEIAVNDEKKENIKKAITTYFSLQPVFLRNA